MICSKCGVYTKKYYVGAGVVAGKLCLYCSTAVNQAYVAKAKAMGVNIVRKKGDFWKLSVVNAPVGAEQWGYQGSGKNPYVVTHYKTRRDGSTTTDGWACSCPSFTQNTPRDDCKHIFKIMASEGFVPSSVSPKNAGKMKQMASVNDKQIEAFKKWQLEQAEKVAKPATDNVLSDGVMTTGRKFR